MWRRGLCGESAAGNLVIFMPCLHRHPCLHADIEIWKIWVVVPKKGSTGPIGQFSKIS